MTPDREIPDSSPDQVEAAVARANKAAREFAGLSATRRGDLLRSIAFALTDARNELVAIAHHETHLPEERLTGELARTTSQLALFADALDEGSWLDLIIDTAAVAPTSAARPDVRRFVLPLGPVLVFAASNFPFAFGVMGGDTASALAAGCPVIVKAHPGHPLLSERTAEIVLATLTRAKAPDGVFNALFGVDAGRQALLDPRVRAAAFTGSTEAGRMLLDLAASRPEPIPFYGELGSLNPVFVSPGSAARRGHEIAAGFVDSFLLGVGQFCTKPGLLFLPSGHGLEGLMADRVKRVAAGRMLNEQLARRYQQVLEGLKRSAGVEMVAEGRDGGPGHGRATLLRIDADAMRANPEGVLVECFGPSSIIVEYGEFDDLHDLVDLLGGGLTATLHAEDEELSVVGPFVERLRERAGRIVWNGWPTGVAVGWATHHGGPYPATTSPLHTSVGVKAMARFLRPISLQNFPQALLPEPLRNESVGLARRIDGHSTTQAIPNNVSGTILPGKE